MKPLGLLRRQFHDVFTNRSLDCYRFQLAETFRILLEHFLNVPKIFPGYYSLSLGRNNSLVSLYLYFGTAQLHAQLQCI